MLQWGRVLLNAERIRIVITYRHYVYASMGPRSVERGKKLALIGITRDNQASMGPRSVERGKGKWNFGNDFQCWLQWGRVLLNAESADPDHRRR